jgi:hypothetical protein
MFSPTPPPGDWQAVEKRQSDVWLKSPSPLSLFNNPRKLLFQQPASSLLQVLNNKEEARQLMPIDAMHGFLLKFL